MSVLSGLREDTGRIDGHSGVRLIHPTGRQTGQPLGYCAPKRTSGRKKTKGSHKQPLWNRSRKIPIPGQPAERPEHSAEGDRNAGFTHVRTYAVATPSGQPDLPPFRYKTRNGPSAAGIMPDAVTKRRRGSGRTGRGNEPPSKNTTNTNKKRSPASLQGSLRRRLPTLPHETAVPSALMGLTSLFGMGRGGTPLL